MNDEIIKKSIIKLALDDSSKILLFDVFNDEITDFLWENGKFDVRGKKNLTSYLDEMKTNIEEQYLKEYMNSISIPKLQEAKKDGQDKIHVTYKTFNNKIYANTCMLVDVNGNNCILVLSQEKQEKSDKQEESSIKFNSLIDAISDAIIKIQNVFNLGNKKLSSVEDYINAIFAALISNYPELRKSLNKATANVTSREEDTILIVDDDMVTRNMIKRVFDGDYKIVMAGNGKEAIEYLDANSNKGFSSSSDHVVGIFLDLTMPVLDGFAVLEYLSKKNYLTRVPVVIISGDYEKETRAKVYNYNIADMLEKPFDFEVVKHRVSNFINLYKSSNSLSNLVNNQNEELKDLLNSFIEAYRYDYKDNISRIQNYIRLLSKKVMQDYPEYGLNESKIDKMVEASTYYDVGFYSVPRAILSKNDNFTKDDINKIKNYPLFGEKMINYLFSLTNDSLYKDYSVNIAKYYHENYDGSGYPTGISKDEIPLEAQIASVCIMYNNLRRKGNSKAHDVIVSKSGLMFNPKIVASFNNVVSDFEKVA